MFPLRGPRNIIPFLVVCIFFIFFGAGSNTAFSTEPETVPAAKGGECALCHKGNTMVPETHPDTKGMDLGQCMTCHRKDDPKLTNVLPLSHSHLLSGVSCAGCHGEADPPKFVGTSHCLTCHKPEDLVEATKDVKEANPHNSHYGPELDCDLCHHAHKPSENFCNQCHEFNFVIPSPMIRPAKKEAPAQQAATKEAKSGAGVPAEKKTDEALSNCKTCHSDAEYGEKFGSSVHGILACTTCHTGIDDVAAHMKREKKPELTACASCHRDIALPYENDVHALKAGKTCLDCHGDAHVRKKEDGGTKTAIINRCTACHEKERYERNGHGNAVLKGNEDAASCADCHGLHGIAFYDRETKAGRVQERESYTAACSACHGDEALTKRNNLSVTAARLYHDTYHGKVLDIGFPERVAGCADCHNGHNILPASDPLSTIHESDLMKDCAQCHSGFHARFVKFQAHPDHDDRDRYPVLYWANVFMICLLFCVFLFFWVHTILWWRRAYWKKWRHRGEESLEEAPCTEEMTVYVQRFSWRDRIMHILLMVSFFMLVMSGFPLKYHDTAWAKVLINSMGGAALAGFWHRAAATVLWGLFLYTCWLSLKFLFPKGQVRGWLGRLFGPESLCFNLKDWDDMKGMFRWFFNRGEMPRFERWTYWEKFDFFAVFWGMFVIGLSGLILWFPELFSYILPGWMINVATVAHSEEAFLAAVFIFTVHFFHNHLVPNKFPLESNIFTGRYTIAALKEERPEEYERIVAENRLESLKRRAPGVPSRLVASFIGIAAVLLGLFLTILIFWAAFFY